MSIFATQNQERNSLMISGPDQVVTEGISLPGRPWHAVYTRSRAEKRLMMLLSDKGIEAYVPLRQILKQWSDRRKMVEEPLIRSYCFVRPQATRYQDVLNTPGAVRYVWFSGKPAAIPDRQIELLKSVAGSDLPVEHVTGQFQAGTKVRIISGPMTGYTGELVSSAGKHRVILRIDHLETALAISIAPAMLEKVKE